VGWGGIPLKPKRLRLGAVTFFVRLGNILATTLVRAGLNIGVIY
jgi:hypothetical protein